MVFLELIKFKGLIAALVNRQLVSRYRGSALGFCWSLLNPLILMLTYTLVFKFYMRFDQENYSIYLFCGLLPWIWLSSGLIEATSAISGSGSLITKSLFPPQILAVAAILTNFIHYLLSLVLLIIFLFIYQISFTWTWLILPFIFLLQILMMYGVALLTASLNVFYRDVQHLLASLFGFLFFLCPILYSIDIVPARFQWTMKINPLAQLIECYQKVILDGQLPTAYNLITVFIFGLLTYLIGSKVYQNRRESFAEYL